MFTKRSIIIGVLIALGVIGFLARGVIVPFILGAAFAYVFNPVVKFISRKTRLSRFWSVIVVYIILITLIAYGAFWVVSQMLRETRQVTNELKNLTSFGHETIQSLPEWSVAGKSLGLQTLVVSILKTFSNTAVRVQDSLLPIFTGAVGFVVKFLVFIISSFYFLKDGPIIVETFVSSFSEGVKNDLKELLHRMNVALGGYLRGQLLLILIMTAASSLFLTILGIKFALTFGILTGFLELIPFIGPVVATSLVAGVSLLTETNNFGLTPAALSIVIVIGYFIFRQLEDYFVIPQLLGKLTRLHPLLVLFSVLVGGAIAGPIGFILGVPIAACGRILVEYAWERAE